jgi:hypothetical protein
MDERPLFYCVSAGRDRGTGLVWSRPFDTSREARNEGRRLLQAGEAALTFVVRSGPEGRTIMLNNTQPPGGRRVIDHYLALLEALKE